MIGQLVKCLLNPETAEVEIRPRDVDACIEVDWYASVDNPGVGISRRRRRSSSGRMISTFSPFDRGTFEPLLRTAVSNLDANGIYWPNVVPAEDRTLPKADDKLKVTDTWVLFARPRNNNVFLQDLEKLKAQAEQAEDYPPAVSAIVTEPATNNPIVDLPPFRGVSASYHSERSASERTLATSFSQTLQRRASSYHPAAGSFRWCRRAGATWYGQNAYDRQRHLSLSCRGEAGARNVDEGRSIGGPAGTTSGGNPSARYFAADERTGWNEAVRARYPKIASEVQSLDRGSTARMIKHLEDSIDALHGKLASIDRNIGDWAKINLAKIILETEEIDPKTPPTRWYGTSASLNGFPTRLELRPSSHHSSPTLMLCGSAR